MLTLSEAGAVILAAGKGTRMYSDIPKVLQRILEEPMLRYVYDAVTPICDHRIWTVVGHRAEMVRAAFPDADLHWALQAPQLGTGHALQQAMPHVVPGGATLMLYGDVPLIRAETLQRLLHAAQDALAILTVELDDPSGYGRIVRQADGTVARIVEQKDATSDERAIREINTGIMAFPTARLADWLARMVVIPAELPIGIVTATIGLWATARLPEYLVALLFFATAAILHLAPPDVLFSGFSSGAFWLVLSGFVLGVTIRKVGLADRIARSLASRLTGSWLHMVGGVVLLTYALAFIIDRKSNV